jgi:hypothetical protein
MPPHQSRAPRPRLRAMAVISPEIVVFHGLKAAGRAPMHPMRNRRSPRTTRHTAANQARSRRNRSESGASVWRVVSE